MFTKKKRFPWRSIIFIGVICIVIYSGLRTSIPVGTSQIGELKNTEFQFIYDLTYEKDNQIVYEQNIFAKINEIIVNAKEFIVIDMFLFNDDYDRINNFTNISGELTNALIEQKRKHPNLEIVFITDEINTFYGSYLSDNLEQLRDNNIQVVITDLEQIRDPNPLYSGVWRLLLKGFDTSGKGVLPNPFSPDSPKTTLLSYLKLLNLKANHRKVLITENEALVTSFNAHDASSNHSNIAFSVKGEIINDLLKSENAVVKFSNEEPFNFNVNYTEEENDVKTQLLTEGKIKQELLREIGLTQEGDKIKMAMFYLAEHKIVNELINASQRNVDVKIILDANKDAFGIEKNGVPNRPVAYKLVNKSDGKIEVKWYSTHGEQFHSKITIFEKEDEVVLIGGSANLTRRNISDYNLETNLKVVLPKAHPEAIKVEEYFARLWNNNDAEYTLDFGAYEEKSLFKTIMYHFQERTGLSSF